MKNFFETTTKILSVLLIVIIGFLNLSIEFNGEWDGLEEYATYAEQTHTNNTLISYVAYVGYWLTTPTDSEDGSAGMNDEDYQNYREVSGMCFSLDVSTLFIVLLVAFLFSYEKASYKGKIGWMLVMTPLLFASIVHGLLALTSWL